MSQQVSEHGTKVPSGHVGTDQSHGPWYRMWELGWDEIYRAIISSSLWRVWTPSRVNCPGQEEDDPDPWRALYVRSVFKLLDDDLMLAPDMCTLQ